MNVYCRICGTPGAACGPHTEHPRLLTGEAFFKGATTVAREELSEYTYYVSGIEMTAMMTPTMAARIGATPVGETPAATSQHENNEANRLSSQNRDASLEGVTVKSRKAANKSTG